MTVSKRPDGFKINRFLSRPLTAVLLKTPLKPNHITALSLTFGILSGFLFSTGKYHFAALGALAFQIAAVLDNCDGEIARAKGLKSVFGGWFDVTGDVLTDVALFTGLAFGLLKTGMKGPVCVAWILCASGSLINFFIVVLEKIKGFGPAVFDQPHPEGVQRNSIFYDIGDALREGDSSVFVVLFTLLNRTQILLWAGAVYIQIVWLSAVLLNFKWIFGSAERNENR